MIQQTMMIYDIEQYANAYTLERSEYDDEKFKCNIPKIMPFIEKGTPRVITRGFSSGILINSRQTRPVIQPTVKTANYIEIPRLTFADLSGIGSWNGKWFNGTLAINSKLLCLVINKDINNIHIIDALKEG